MIHFFIFNKQRLAIGDSFFGHWYWQNLIGCFWNLLSTKKTPISSWESLSRSVVIDLGNPRYPGSWELWVNKYSVPGYCGETAEMLWRWAGFELKKQLLEDFFQTKHVWKNFYNDEHYKRWNGDACFSTKCFAQFGMWHISVNLKQKRGKQTKSLWLFFDLLVLRCWLWPQCNWG